MSRLRVSLRDGKGKPTTKLSGSKGFGLYYGRRRLSAYWYWPPGWKAITKFNFIDKLLIQAEILIGSVNWDEELIFTQQIMYQSDFLIFPYLERYGSKTLSKKAKNKRYPQYKHFSDSYQLIDVIPPNSRYRKDISNRQVYTRLDGPFGGDPINLELLNFELKQVIRVHEDNIDESLDLVREIFYEHVKYRFDYFVDEGLHHRLRIKFDMVRNTDLKNGFDVPLAHYKDGISLEREIMDTHDELSDYFYTLTDEFMDEDKKFKEYFKHALGGQVDITGFQFETITEYL